MHIVRYDAREFEVSRRRRRRRRRRSTIERRSRRCLLFAPFAIYLYRSVCFYQLFHYRHSHTDTHSRGTHSLCTQTHMQQDQVEENQTNSLKRNCTTRSQILLRNLLVSFSFVSRRCTQGTTTTTNTAFIFVVELQILLMWHTKHITHAACETYFRGFPKPN